MCASIRSKRLATPAAPQGRAGRRRLGAPAKWAHLPRRTVRLRLTALYGCLFLLSGAGLLAITNVLVAHQATGTAFYVSRDTPNKEVHIQGVVGSFSVPVGVAPLAALPAHIRSAAAAQAGRESAAGQVVHSRSVHVSSAAAGPAPSQVVHSASGHVSSTASGRGSGSASGEPPVTLKTGGVATPQQLRTQVRQLSTLAAKQHTTEQNHLLVISAIALGIMAVLSIALGWLISGRVLRPLRTMTATTRRISEDNLHERLALAGPDDELKDLADTIDGLLARLEAAFEAQRRFVANASHELRTPLTMMRTSLDVAVAKPEPLSPQVGVLEHKLREGLDRADRLVESFLELARAQRGELADHSKVSIARVLSAAIRDRAAAIAERDIDVRAAIADAEVAGSETLLTRMVENVIENAIVHNERGGRMLVESQTDGSLVRVLVESGGPHLDESVVRELAQPFRRLGADRTGSQSGVGLGLSIVAAIAAAHGGELQLHARPEGGLRVLIELPRARPAGAEQPRAAHVAEANAR